MDLKLMNDEHPKGKVFTFKAVIENPGGGGAFVRIPFDVEKEFGRKRVPVQASIGGEPYRGTLVRMGAQYHVLIVLKEIRQKISRDFGDEVEISLEEDVAPRLVEVPQDLEEALEQDPAAKAAFEKLSYTHQREYVRAILEAKQEKTRQNRIARTVEMLKQKRG
jgi:hypothetical protein